MEMRTRPAAGDLWAAEVLTTQGIWVEVVRDATPEMALARAEAIVGTAEGRQRWSQDWSWRYQVEE